MVVVVVYNNNNVINNSNFNIIFYSNIIIIIIVIDAKVTATFHCSNKTEANRERKFSAHRKLYLQENLYTGTTTTSSPCYTWTIK